MLSVCIITYGKQTLQHHSLHANNGTKHYSIYSFLMPANAQIMVFRQMSHIVIRYLR